MKREHEETLEKLIDAYSLEEILDAIANICYEKAQHLRSAWQDPESAKTWEQDGKKIEQVSRRVAS